ncbi:MAG: DUF7570 family protein [Aeromonas veronii]
MNSELERLFFGELTQFEINEMEKLDMMIKENPPVTATEKALSVGNEIKNRLNPYIVDRVERLQDGEIITPEWLDVVEEGGKALLADMNIRKSIAREHIVGYILREYGAEKFGVKNI